MGGILWVQTFWTPFYGANICSNISPTFIFFCYQTYPNDFQYLLKLSRIHIAKIFLFNTEIFFGSRSLANMGFFKGLKIWKYYARSPQNSVTMISAKPIWSNHIYSRLIPMYLQNACEKHAWLEKLQCEHGNSTGSVNIPLKSCANRHTRHPKMSTTTIPEKELAPELETQTDRQRHRRNIPPSPVL